MSKRRNTTGPQPDVRLMVDAEVRDLLKQGKVNMLLTWKQLDKKPEIIEVGTPNDDDTVTVRCKHMDMVGFGYLPNGYPEKYKCTGKTVRLLVEPIEKPEPQEEPEPAPAE